jgi:hypothetical protein
VANQLPAAPGPNAGQDAGKVEFESYSPRNVVLKSQAPSPSVLLLNDRFDPNWSVSVDGKSEKLLQCNYLMRGVYLSPGAHTIQFRFQPPIGWLWVSLAAITAALPLLAITLLLAPARPSTP